MSTKTKDKKYLGRGEGQPKNIEVKSSRGALVYDERGKEYIDFVMGWCVGNIGWNLKELDRQIKKVNVPTYISPTYYYKGWSELAELLAKIVSGKLVKSFRATGGTEAVEIAMQAAMTHTKRSKFISIEGSYHGHSIGAMSIGSSDFRSWYPNLMPDCHKINPPLNEAAAREVEVLLSKGDIAAFISEPIICNLGVEIPEKKFFDIVVAACKKYGTLFIADEVATGFGRTGKMFACEHYNLEPDILCMAKGLTGGYGALATTIMTEEVAKSFEGNFRFYSTFGWHPLNVAATTIGLKYLLKNKAKLLRNATTLSEYFEKRLRAMNFRESAQIRIKGLAIGVRFESSNYGSEIIQRCVNQGLLIADATSKDIVMYPPLNLDMKTAKKGLDILEKCL